VAVVTGDPEPPVAPADGDSDPGTDVDPRPAPGAGVVVGVGNPTMGDDGLGRAVVRAVRTGARHEAPVEATFAGTTAFAALEAMSGTERGVLVDAVADSGPPGTVYRYRLDRRADPTPEVTMHDVTFLDALESCGSAYDLPERVVLVGIVPGRVETSLELSDAVAGSVPVAAAAVHAELGYRRRHGSGVDREPGAHGGADPDPVPDPTPVDSDAEVETDRGDTHVRATWYCRDCERRIEADDVDDHEARGHSVTGRLRPERLLAQDPWATGEEGSTAENGDADGGTGSRPPDADPDRPVDGGDG
jgi:hydrogenase maturation protease